MSKMVSEIDGDEVCLLAEIVATGYVGALLCSHS